MEEIRELKSYKTFEEFVKCPEFDVEYARQKKVKTVVSRFDQDKQEYIVIVIKDVQ